ncbi:MAG: hypothetical protein E7773_07630 [Sphingomonas sp.]|uniref:hypothetical protein n=1 Tax=Sphingomonas sp. TaxID=28214 RepID=UPI0011F4BA2F|nr:hypothetical protein [Sphingomonas sp.]THD36374.1 MAG: hypothetical protein E7773_07630 [Sphingomonas sp.]
MTVVGLVVEGTLDFPIIGAFLEAELPETFARPIRLKHLQPVPDAASGGYSGGGWGRVVGWCKAHHADGIETYFNPIEEEDVVCDLIVVQIDGDAMTPCSDHASFEAPSETCSIEERIESLEKMVLEWLAPTPARVSQIRFAFPTMHSEAWLLAGLKPNEAPWENEADAKTPFRALKPAQPKMNMASWYKIKSEEVGPLGDIIAPQSRSFSSFRDNL